MGGFNPEVALGVNTNLLQPGGAGAINPLQAMSTIADVQRTRLQTQGLQNELDAKAASAQVLAMSPDLATGLRTLERGPMAPYIPQVIESLAGADQAQTGAAAKRLEMSNSGLDSFIKMQLNQPKGGMDQQLWDTQKNTVLALQTDPAARAAMGNSIDNLWHATMDNTNGDPNKIQNNRLMMLMPHLSTDDYQMYSGTRTVEPGKVLMGATPDTAYNQPNMGAPGSTGQPAMDAPLPGPTYGQGGGTGTAASPTTGAPATGAPIVATPRLNAGRSSSDNPYQPMQVTMGTGGIPMPGSLNSDQAKAAQQAYDTNTPFYGKQATSLGQLSLMENSFDQMMKDGKFMQLGPGAGIRTQFAGIWNQFARTVGLPQTDMINPAQIASSEDTFKQTRTLGIQTLQTLMGNNQREAESIVDGMIAAQPGVQNTYLGASMLLESIRSQVSRGMDMHDYQTMWRHNYGNLANSAEAFDHDYPAAGYSERALNVVGMNANMSATDMVNLAKQYHLTPEQLNGVLKNQFNNDGTRIQRGPTGELPGQVPTTPGQ